MQRMQEKEWESEEFLLFGKCFFCDILFLPEVFTKIMNIGMIVSYRLFLSTSECLHIDRVADYKIIYKFLSQIQRKYLHFY